MGVGARFFCCRVFDGGVPSSLLLLLLLLFTFFFFTRFLEGWAVSLLEGVRLEYPSACSSEENARNFIASARVSNLRWCRFCLFVSSRHSFHTVVKHSGLPPPFSRCVISSHVRVSSYDSKWRVKHTVFLVEIWMGGCGKCRGLHVRGTAFVGHAPQVASMHT